jgi:hypothetical protein
VLSRLGEQGLVVHRGEYWAVTDQGDVATALSATATARAATERFGEEDPAEWGSGVDENDRTAPDGDAG